ncbi:hypothetical protein BZA77DRAFT_357403 [Pyronema omphalodes]|nr:hypothetical protein BZA77DRAFT_357403 [Pyronema omphalodes]
MPHVTALLTPLDLKSLQTLSKHLGLSATGTKPWLSSVIYNLPLPPRPERLLSLVFGGGMVTSCLLVEAGAGAGAVAGGVGAGAATAAAMGAATEKDKGIQTETDSDPHPKPTTVPAKRKTTRKAAATTSSPATTTTTTTPTPTPIKALIHHHPLHLPTPLTPPFGYLTTSLSVSRVVTELLQLQPDYVLIQHKRWDLLRGNYTGVVEGMVFAALVARLGGEGGGAGGGEGAGGEGTGTGTRGKGSKGSKGSKTKKPASSDWRQGDLRSPAAPAGIGIEGVDGNLVKALGAKAKQGVKEVFVEAVGGDGVRRRLVGGKVKGKEKGKEEVTEKVTQKEEEGANLRKVKEMEALVQAVCWKRWMRNREAVLLRGDWPEGCK